MHERRHFVLPLVQAIWLFLLVGGCSEVYGFDTIAASQSSIDVLQGRVVKIADGDTVTILTADKEQLRVRLAEIDAPERGQPYSNRARQLLSELVWDQDVMVKVIDIDRHGRIIGRIFVGDTDISAELVKRGAAWVYRRYSRDPGLLHLEDDARLSRRGIWALPESERFPPWEWRQASRPPRP